MKVVKKLVLFCFISLVLAVSVFADKLNIFAEDFVYNLSDFNTGIFLKSGDKLLVKKDQSHCEYLNMRLQYVDPETGEEYWSAYNIYTGEIYDPNNITQFFETKNLEAFEQSAPGYLPTINGESINWYILVEGIDFNYCSTNGVILGVHDYGVPESKLKCEDDEVMYGEKLKCEMEVDYSFTLNALLYVFDNKNLILDDIKVIDNDAWELVNYYERNQYVFESINIPKLEDASKRETTKVFRFTVTPKEDKDDTGRIFIAPILYADKFGEYPMYNIIKDIKIKKYSAVSNVTTTTRKPDQDQSLDTEEDDTADLIPEDELKNPETGVEDYLGFGIFVVLVGLALFIRVRNNRLFKGI